MLFSDCLPEKLKDHSFTSAFMSVLDSLQNLKSEIIAESLRVDNFAILTDRKWLLKKLEDFGVTNIPIDYPIQSIQQYLLNVDLLCRTRGSKLGVELYCSVLSLGEVIVNDENFYVEPNFLVLNSEKYGYITSDNAKSIFYLVDDNDLEPLAELSITIKSKYFDGSHPIESKIIKEFLEQSINEQLWFTPKKKVTFTYLPREDFYYHKSLNTYFI